MAALDPDQEGIFLGWKSAGVHTFFGKKAGVTFCAFYRRGRLFDRE
jgi:hypothetical protein